MRRSLIAMSLIGGATAASAEPVRMTDDAIRQQLTGVLLEIDTPLNTTIPVRITRDGLVSGEAGTLALVLGAAKDRGRWWTDHDQLCVKWFRWFDAKPRCSVLHQDGKRIYWQETNGESGTATIVEGGPPDAAPVTVASNTGEPERDRASPPVAVAQAPEPPSSDEPAPAEAPALRFAVAGLTDVATPPAPQAGGLSRLGVGEPPKEDTPLAQAPVSKHPAAKRLTLKARGAPQKAPATPPVQPRESRAAPKAPSFRVAGVGIGDRLKVRSGPSEFHASVGDISPAGRGVQITGGCRDVWCPIRYGHVVGWVNRYYLAEDGGAAAALERTRR